MKHFTVHVMAMHIKRKTKKLAAMCLNLEILNTNTTTTTRDVYVKVTLTWHACKCKIRKLHQRYILCEICTSSMNTKVQQAEIMYLVFTWMPGESYRRRLSLLSYLCYVSRALIVCRLWTTILGLGLFQICISMDLVMCAFVQYHFAVNSYNQTKKQNRNYF